jgi:hypothetical protein
VRLEEAQETMVTTPVEPREGPAFREGIVEREEVLERYRCLREISRTHGGKVLKRVAKKTLLGWGKRLGLVRRKTFVAEGFEEMTLAFDLAVYSAPSGKVPPVERYRRMARFPAGGDEAIMLEAMCRSRFTIFVVKRRHAAAGLVVDDLFRKEEIWLMDEGLEETAPESAAFASRVTKPDAFHMTTGAAIPVTRDVLAEVAASFRFRDDDPSLTEGTNVRFIEAVYRVAVSRGLLAPISFA